MNLTRVAALPVAMAVAATMAACSGQNTGEENITPLPVSDLNPRPAEELTTGGELRVPVEGLGRSLNPMSADADPSMDAVRNAFLPTLFQVSPTGEITPNPEFLNDFEVTSDPGAPTNVTLKLNPEATWGDDSPVTADDLRATWRACSGQVPENRCREGLGLDQIRDIVVVSPTEASVSFHEATPDWTEPFTRVGILKASSVGDPQTFNDGWGEPKSEWLSGPFAIKRTDREHNVLGLEPNDTWWGPEPKLAKLTIVARDRDQQGDGFRRADIDAFDAGSSPQAFTAGQEATNQILRRSGGPEVRTLVFNTQSAGPVSDPLVRKAIALTLDRSRVGTAALAELDHTASAVDNNVYLYGQDGYVDNAESTETERDLRKAKGALDDAGWKAGGDGARTRDGQPLEITVLRVVGDPVSEAETENIAAQLGEVGIQVVTEDVDQNAWADGGALRTGTFQMATMSQDHTAWPLADLSERFGTGGDQNWSKISDPELDTALEQLSAESDPARRQGIANHVDELAWQQLGTLPLYQVPESVFTRPRLANYGAFGVGTVDWAEVGYVR